MNILTFDIEEWYLESMRNNRSEKYAEYDSYLGRILDLLDERQLKATFFCVGKMGVLFPEVIRRIHSRGHEVGCHSNIHTWLNKMNEAECREDTHEAVDSLEQCIGEKVRSYRAPAFSIGGSNKWSFEILAENGIERDASVFPSARDFGGFPNFGHKAPVIVDYQGTVIKEFPVCMTKILGKEAAYSGGGYFRFFPLSFIENRMALNGYNMCYFHINDLIPETKGLVSKKEYEAYFHEPGTLKARYSRFVKSNLGKKHAFDKMSDLIRHRDFMNLQNADCQIDWETGPVVKY